MRHDNFDKKIRFSYFLPSGVISPVALELDVNLPAEAYCHYDPNTTMQERIDACFRAHKQRMAALHAMEDYGYTEKATLKFGKQKNQNFHMYKLTRSGIYFLTNTPDKQVEEERLTSAVPTIRKLQKNSYLDADPDSIIQRNTLFSLARRKKSNPSLRNDFNEIYMDALYHGDLTILASEPHLAKSIEDVPKARNHQLYKSWRIGNIEALFRANRFLTSIDRRPFVWQEKSEEHLQPKYMDFHAFAQYTLSKWYEEHETSYTFLDPFPDDSEARYTAWQTTPAFYCVQDIPGFESLKEENMDMNMGGANSLVGHSFMGAATGKKTDYIVYHTQPGITPWKESVERTTSITVRRAFDTALGIENTGENAALIRYIKSAIIVCYNVNQFAALFTNAKEKLPRRWAKEKRVGRPYQTVCIVPLNHSGSMQLRCLMMSTPAEYESIIASDLLTHPGFSERPTGGSERDNIYKLSYNKRPVLVAHTMDFQKLYWAMEDYLEGKKFYVSCYPEQAKYIQKIMPEVEFL